MTQSEGWIVGSAGKAEPTYLPVRIEPSPAGADDTARLLTIATFNGLCRLVTAVAERGMLSGDDLAGLHEVMTSPLDDPEMRDDEVIACCRFTVESVMAQAEWLRRSRKDE